MAYIDPEDMTNEETTKLRKITPIIEERWAKNKILMEFPITAGYITIDEYNQSHRGKPKFADYLLLWKDNVPLAIVEAKGEEHSADEGYEQAKEYGRKLDVPFIYATNGDDLIEFDAITGINKNLKIGEFPTMEELWNRYCRESDMDDKVVEIYTHPYYTTSTGKKPRYYQRNAINRTVMEIAKGNKRILLVMATGTGKTFTAFQILYRFWNTRTCKKILFLADRNILVDQTMKKDFKPFMDAMEKIDNKHINTSKEVFLGLYQQLKSADNDYYKQLPPDFFDLICIDECHRSSANSDSNWHEILEYFGSAIQIGMTATPKDGGIEDCQTEIAEIKESLDAAKNKGRTKDADKLGKDLAKAQERLQKAISQSNLAYFGNPIYTYTLKQGIEDGFLAPYKVVSVELNVDKFGWKPAKGTLDTDGNPVEERYYYQDDFDRKIVSPERRKLVAKRITEFMKTNDMRYAKTIVFCEDISHCQEMVRLLENENADLVAEDSRYITQITGDNEFGKAQLDNFIDSSSKYPVIAVTSKLLSTGVDAETCEIIVLDRKIGSMTEFKQIVGRGTRIKEEYNCDGEEKSKMYFTILDFRKNYLKFNDPEFDGTPVTVTEVEEGNAFPPPPVRPTPPSDEELNKYKPKHKSKIARVNGIEVEIVNEDVMYRDVNGNLVTQNLNSATTNNIVTQYPTFESFKQAWLLNSDKMKLAEDLLLGIDWSEKFKIQYGYAVDEFDIIAYFGYDIEPPMSKHQRTQSSSVTLFLDEQDIEIKEMARCLLDVYAETSFTNLKEIKNVFGMETFADMGITPLSAIKKFGGKDKYFKFLKELETKLYQD